MREELITRLRQELERLPGGTKHLRRELNYVHHLRELLHFRPLVKWLRTEIERQAKLWRRSRGGANDSLWDQQAIPRNLLDLAVEGGVPVHSIRLTSKFSHTGSSPVLILSLQRQSPPRRYRPRRRFRRKLGVSVPPIPTLTIPLPRYETVGSGFNERSGEKLEEAPPLSPILYSWLRICWQRVDTEYWR